MGLINHTICVVPVSVNGIKIFDDKMNEAKSISQISCIVRLKSNPTVQSRSSMPLRHNSQKQPKIKDYMARWHNDQSSIGYSLNKTSSEQKHFTFDTKLDGKKAKVFEFSIHLLRGAEEIEIGVTSLTFIGVVLRAELDIPIYQINSEEARKISLQCGEKKHVFSRTKKREKNIANDIRSQLNSNSHNPNMMFSGGDRGRSYQLNDDASIRVKVSSIILPDY